MIQKDSTIVVDSFGNVDTQYYVEQAKALRNQAIKTLVSDFAKQLKVGQSHSKDWAYCNKAKTV